MQPQEVTQVTQSRGDDFLSIDDGTQHEAGKVAVMGNSLAINQLRQKFAIAMLSDYNYCIIMC